MAVDHLYATYFEAVRVDPNLPETDRERLWINRWQYVVMPKHPVTQSGHVVFQRYQNNQQNRSTWKGYLMRDPLKGLRSNLDQLQLRDHVILHPPIVVALTPAEVDSYVGDHNHYKTPWEVLNRATPVARRLGFKL